MLRRLTIIGWTALLALTITGCGAIDEDLSDCDVPQAELNYELTLVTNLTTELTTELSTETDTELADALRKHLANIFTDFAHDVDLSFYETKGDSILLQNDKHIMNANQASYTLNLPMREYMHLAAANIVENNVVAIDRQNFCHKSILSQERRDTIDSHTTGLFTARQPMEVLGNVSQHFNVRLYMANCAAALVIDPKDRESLNGVRVYSTGFATGFNICDSLFRYEEHHPIVRTTPVTLDNAKVRAYCSVSFPSPEPKATRTVIETLEPFIAQPDEKALWEFRVYVPQPDGTVTETLLRIKEPLRAGQLKIIKCWIGEHGAVVSRNSEVSTSVTLDWKKGLVIEY